MTTERHVVQRLLLAFQADEDLQEALIAQDAGRTVEGEVGEIAARAAGAWLAVEFHIKGLHREAQKRLMVHMTDRSAA